MSQKMTSKADTVKDDEIVNDDLEALQNWSITNDMKFNVNKCSVLHCGRLNRNIEYKIYGQKLRATESEKDLVAILNNNMKFKDQVTYAVKKTNKTLGMIKRNSNILIKKVLYVHCETTIRICCVSMVTISNWFEREIRAITKKNNKISEK